MCWYLQRWQVVAADILANNGVVAQIDTVLDRFLPNQRSPPLQLRVKT
jgi:uncharacterized surface protein with fasciclin (FAS1) repeats